MEKLMNKNYVIRRYDNGNRHDKVLEVLAVKGV